MNVLVTGGAGYIGSHAVKTLMADQHDVVVVDNLYRGHRRAVPAGAAFHQLDISDADALADVMRDHRIDCIMHFAALAYVGESVTEPHRYYRNNTAGTLQLLDAAARAGVKRFVFSSTAATYGMPEEMPIVETTPQQPINPYGWSKLFVEQMLRDIVTADAEFGFAALRYFNVAGCARDGTIGEDHDPESHLIPIILQVALGQREHVTIFGTDYDTPDGTCIRDYIHVEDLCAAHVTAMRALRPSSTLAFNLGIGRGYSVNEVIESARRVTGHAIPAVVGARRAGDPPTLVASPQKIEQDLGWRAEVTSLDDIIASAWQWFRAHPNGYGDSE